MERETVTRSRDRAAQSDYRRAPRGRLLLLARRRLGSRYAVVVPAVPIQLLYLVDVVGLGALSLYVDMSWPEFARLLAATLVIQTAYNAFLVGLLRRATRPLEAWLGGERAETASVEAWRAAAGLPLEFMRATMRSGFYVWANVGWSAYAAWDLGLPATSLPALMAGVLIAQLYAFTLIFLAIERVMRPLLAEIWPSLGDDAQLDAPALPLRWRLLAALPVINVITGAVVAGLSAPDQADLGDLGVDVLIAVAVAFSVSLWLTLRLGESITVPIDVLRSAAHRAGTGDLGARVPVASTDETGRLAEAFNRMMRGLQERQRLQQAFGAFVDPNLTEQVARAGPDAIQAARADVSALFMDIRDFTQMAEHADPEQVVEALNDLYECVVPIVTRHGGHANKFIADGMLAVFGAPVRHADHADRAIAAAIEIAAAVEARFGDELRVGVGVNSGAALAGTVGGGGRLDFTVIGDAINTAARVEAATRDTGDAVLITGETKRRLRGHHRDWVPRGALSLKGRAEPVDVFAAPPRQPEGG